MRWLRRTRRCCRPSQAKAARVSRLACVHGRPSEQECPSVYYYPRVLPNYMHTEPERECAHQNQLSVKTLTQRLKSVSQIVMRVAVMVFAGPREDSPISKSVSKGEWCASTISPRSIKISLPFHHVFLRVLPPRAPGDARSHVYGPATLLLYLHIV